MSKCPGSGETSLKHGYGMLAPHICPCCEFLTNNEFVPTHEPTGNTAEPLSEMRGVEKGWISATENAPRRGHYADMEWARDILIEAHYGHADPDECRKAAHALTTIIDTFSPAAILTRLNELEEG